VPLLPIVAVLAAGVVSDDVLTAVGGRWSAWGTPTAVAVVMLASVLGAGLLDHRLLGELVTTDARAEALAVIEQRVPADGTVGLITEPWFSQPPVDYCNGGVALRGNPIWGAYRRPVRELAILGLSVEELRAAAPDAVVLTGVEAGVARAAGEPGAEEFVAALREQGYERIAKYDGSPWGGGDLRPPAQDLSYPFPWIEVWAHEAMVTGGASGGIMNADERTRGDE